MPMFGLISMVAMATQVNVSSSRNSGTCLRGTKRTLLYWKPLIWVSEKIQVNEQYEIKIIQNLFINVRLALSFFILLLIFCDIYINMQQFIQ